MKVEERNVCMCVCLHALHYEGSVCGGKKNESAKWSQIVAVQLRGKRVG